MKLKRSWIVPIVFLAILGCSSVSDQSDSSPDQIDGDWLIPKNDIKDVLVKDGIPSIEFPLFTPAKHVDFIPDERMVVGIRIGDDIRAYPHQILDWHEIVNDRVGDAAVAITYCPLTNTAIGWNRDVNGETTQFGVSGKLFRNNLVPYDRTTESHWSQMQMRSVSGPLIGTNISTVDLIETTWGTWKAMYPESEVMNRPGNYDRNYGGYAYGQDYLTNDAFLLFPRANHDNRLPNKDRLHGVIFEQPAKESAQVRVYPINGFGQGIKLINDQIQQQEFVVLGSTEHNFAASFKTITSDGTELNLEPVQDALPVVMKDQEGNRWDLFGFAVEGPRKGARLTPTLSYTGYWFAWADFFPGLEIYQFESQ